MKLLFTKCTCKLIFKNLQHDSILGTDSGCRIFELLSFQNRTDRINILKFSIDAYIAYISFIHRYMYK